MSHENLSIYKIFTSKKMEHTSSILEFVLWLRLYNDISESYESKVVCSLAKLLKWRFRKESCEGDKNGFIPPKRIPSFVEFPVFQKIRELSRGGIGRQALALSLSRDDFNCQWDKTSTFLDESPIASEQPTPTTKVAPAVAPTPTTTVAPAVTPTPTTKVAPAVVPTPTTKVAPAVAPTPTTKVAPAVAPTSNSSAAKSRPYCHTHGYVLNWSHSSVTCRFRGPGHIETASSDNRQGGSEYEWKTLENAKIWNPPSGQAVYDTVSTKSFEFSRKYANPLLQHDHVWSSEYEAPNSSAQQVAVDVAGHYSAIQSELYGQPKLPKLVTAAVALKYDDMKRCKTLISRRPILENANSLPPNVLAGCNTISRKCNLDSIDVLGMAQCSVRIPSRSPRMTSKFYSPDYFIF